MDDKIYSLAKEINAAINNDPRFVKLYKLEKEIENKEEITALVYQKDISVTNYSDLLKIYRKDSVEIKKVRKELIKKKENLENHSLVKEYDKLKSVLVLFLRLTIYYLKNIGEMLKPLCVIARLFGHLQLSYPENDPAIRPTKDRIREGLFSSLEDIEGKVFLYLWSGCDLMDIEANSRGASFAYFIDNNQKTFVYVKENIKILGITNS